MPNVSLRDGSSTKSVGGGAKRVLSRFVGLLLLIALLFGGYLAARPFVSIQPVRNRILQWINLNTSLFVISQEDVHTYIQRNGIVTTGSATTTHSISGPLRRHPTNPRYFTDDSGQVVYLTGSHTWLNLQDGGLTDPPGVFNYTTWLDFLEAHHHNFFRLWRWEESKWVVEWSDPYYFEPMPYERTGPGNALDGKPKFDLNRFDQAYFDRMRQRVIEAGQRNMYVSIMLFNGWSVSYPKGFYNLGNPWEGHPYNASNNINGIDGDPNHDNSGSETHELKVAAVTALQEAYVRKVIDTVNDLDNVLYEISNESDGGSQAWQYHMIDLVKEYEAGQPKQHPVGMTVEWPNGDNQDLFDSSADWVSLNGPLDSPPVADGSKVIIADTDHLCGICGDRIWAWKSFTRGENPLFMDQYDDGYKLEGGGYDMNNPNDVSLRKNLGYTHDYANRINLALMTPRGDLASSKYVLANPVASGAEYLVYLPNGGNVTVDLSATEGELKVEWFNPATGVTTTSDTVNGGAKRSFSAPFGGDAVLYLYQQGPPPATHQLFVPIVGKGKVSMSPSGPYTEGQMVTLTANPAAGWSFSSWSGDFSGVSNPLTITIAADTTITATFSEVSPPQNYTLTVNATGQGQVLVEPSGPYTTGQVITLTANPATDWQFAAWSGDLVGTANPITFAITANSAVTATFVPHSETELYSLIVHLNGQGQVDFTPFGPYTSRQIITLTARPADDWVFSGWSGAITGIENPATLAITTNAVITGNFAALTNQTPYALKMTTVGRGTVVVDPPGPYSADQQVTLSALPVPGWRFDHWEGDLRGNDNPLTTAVSQTLSVTAFFSLEPLFLPFVQKEALRSTIPPLQAQTGNSDHLLNDAYRCGSPDVALILPILTLLDEFWPCIDKSGGNSPTPQPLGH